MGPKNKTESKTSPISDLLSASITLAVVWGAFSLLFEMPDDSVMTTNNDEVMVARELASPPDAPPLPVVMKLKN